MDQMIYLLTKQIQLLEIEIGQYKIAKSFNDSIIYTKEYYLDLIVIRNKLKSSVNILTKTSTYSDKYMVH